MKVGVLGCGEIARNVHLPVLQRLGVKVAALADPVPDNLAAARALAPEAQVSTNAQELLGRHKLDAVVVCAPPSLHAPLTREVLQTGTPVYVEKPFATCVREAESVCEAQEASGSWLMVGFNQRFHPLLSQLRRRLDEVGEVTAIRTVFSSSTYASGSWRSSAATGGGALLELGVHHFDLCRYVTGQGIVRVGCQGCRTGASAWTTLELSSGAHCQSFFALNCADEERVEVYGTLGRLAVRRHLSAEIEFQPRSGAGERWRRLCSLLRAPFHLPVVLQRMRSPGHDVSYTLALAAFVEAVRNRAQRSPGASATDGLEAVRVVEAAGRAQRECRVVTP